MRRASIDLRAKMAAITDFSASGGLSAKSPRETKLRSKMENLGSGLVGEQKKGFRSVRFQPKRCVAHTPLPRLYFVAYLFIYIC